MLHAFAKQATHNKLFVIWTRPTSTNNITMLRDRSTTKHGNILQTKLQTVLCTRTLFCMHHLKQGGLGRTRWQKMHTTNCSPGSPQNGSWFYGRSCWTFQRHIRLLTTRGLHRFQRKDVQRLPQTTRQWHIMALNDIKHKHAQAENLMKSEERSSYCRVSIVQALQAQAKTIPRPTHAKNCSTWKDFKTHHITTWGCCQLDSSIKTGNKQCLWFQPATLRLTLSNHCPSQTKRIPDDPKPTDHNGQYTQSTPGNTFQWSVAGTKLQKMD